MNSTGPDVCPFSNINDVLTEAETGGLNITQIVQSCPNVCSLAWGTGNPDLSGIGVRAPSVYQLHLLTEHVQAQLSYILQVALTIIFGPLFVAIFGLRKRLRLRRYTQEYFQQVQNSFLDVSAQFTIPVAVAAVVRLSQSPPFFEISFLQSLTTMQFFGLLSTTLAAVVAMPKRLDIRRILVIFLYLIVDFGFFMGVMSFLRTSKASATTIQELVNACKEYQPIAPGFIYPAPSQRSGLSNLTLKEYDASKTKEDWIILGLVLAGIAALITACFIFKFLYRILKERHPGFLGVIVSGLSGGVIYEMVQLQGKRLFMKAVTGSNFVDNQWGFGQVIAIFLWIPLVIQVIYYFCGMFPHFINTLCVPENEMLNVVLQFRRAQS
jgi:hypothetical protein